MPAILLKYTGSILKLVAFLQMPSFAAWGQTTSPDCLHVVATTNLVAELVQEVGRERVRVTALMKAGVDPHLYRPTQSDITLLNRADAVFYHGLRLEGRMQELLTTLARKGRKTFAITDCIPKYLLIEPQDLEGIYDPHVWFDVAMWSQTLPCIVQALTELDPSGKSTYQHNAEQLQQRLDRLNNWCIAKAQELPPQKRILVTSHDAFSYFGRAYGFQVVALQGINTVSEASLAAITAMVDFIKKNGVKAVFIEIGVNPAAIQQVATHSGVPIAGEIYSDSLGAKNEIKNGFDVGTYEGMIRYNMSTIVEALK